MTSLPADGNNRPRDDSLRALAALFDSLSAVIEYASAGRQAFDGNRQTQDAIMYRILCAGEAAIRFCDAYEGRGRPDQVARLDHVNADIRFVELDADEWRGLTGIRDVLAHRIDEQNLEIIWTTASQEAPLMLPPIRDALMRAEVRWFSSGDTPGRRRAQGLANEAFREPLEKLLANLETLSLTTAQLAVQGLSRELQDLIAEIAGQASQEVPATVNAAAFAEEALTKMAERDAKIEAIAAYLQESYDESELESKAYDHGSRPIIEEVLCEHVMLLPEDRTWDATLTATVQYEDDEGDILWDHQFVGYASGAIDADGEIEVEEFRWEDDEPGDGDHDETEEDPDA